MKQQITPHPNPLPQGERRFLGNLLNLAEVKDSSLSMENAKRRCCITKSMVEGERENLCYSFSPLQPNLLISRFDPVSGKVRKECLILSQMNCNLFSLYGR